MPTLSGEPGAPRPRKTARTSRSGFAFIANRSRYGIPAVASAAWNRRAFSR